MKWQSKEDIWKTLKHTQKRTNRKQNLSDTQPDTHDYYPQFLKTNGKFDITGVVTMLKA